MISVNGKKFNNDELHIIFYNTNNLACYIAFKNEEHIQHLKNELHLLIKIDDEVIIDNCIERFYIVNRLKEISDIEYINNGRILSIFLGGSNGN